MFATTTAAEATQNPFHGDDEGHYFITKSKNLFYVSTLNTEKERDDMRTGLQDRQAVSRIHTYNCK